MATEAPYHVQIRSIYSPPPPARISFVRFSPSLGVNVQGFKIQSQTNLIVLDVLS